MHSLVISFFNFFVLIALLTYYLRSPLRAFVQDRQKQIREGFLLAQKQLEEARQKYDEFSSKLAAIDSEISALRSQNSLDLVALQESSSRQITNLKSRIFSDAQQRSQLLFESFKIELRREWTQAVLEDVEQMIHAHLTELDQKRMNDEYLSHLKKVTL